MEYKDDIDKFMQEAENYDPEDDDSKQSYPETCEKEEEPKGKKTDIIQYCKNGPGFSAAGETIRVLPAGAYSIQHVSQVLAFCPEQIHTDSLIRFPDSRADQLLKEIQGFWELKEEFKKGNDKAFGGFLHKRGYLIFGPPGSGKSCLLKFVIKDIIDRKGIVLYGDINPIYVIEGLKTIKKIEPDKQIVVILEDFDDLIHSHGESKYLSLLDGENSMDNVLFIATTNYVSRFDPRMYNRPGRLSDVIYIGMPSAGARRLYLETKLKVKDDIDWIVDNTDNFSLDHLKALVLGVYFEKKDLEQEVNRLRKLFDVIKDDKGNKSTVGLCAPKDPPRHSKGNTGITGKIFEKYAPPGAYTDVEG